MSSMNRMASMSARRSCKNWAFKDPNASNVGYSEIGSSRLPQQLYLKISVAAFLERSG